MLRAAGEIETMQENIQGWFELDGDPAFQLLTDEEIAAIIYFFYLYSSAVFHLFVF
jgi:hypothetical protein